MPTETPNPDPFAANCVTYNELLALYVDDFEEARLTESDELGKQFGIAKRITLLATLAEDRCFENDWTSIRRKSTYTADSLEKRALYLWDLQQLQHSVGGRWMGVESPCSFYLGASIAPPWAGLRQDNNQSTWRLMFAVNDYVREKEIKPIADIWCEDHRKKSKNRKGKK